MGQVWRFDGTKLVCPGRSEPPMASPEFIYGTTKPTAVNTGYAPGTEFTEVTSDLTITTNNAVYDGYEFIGGKVQVKASGVTFRNCWFRGQQNTGVTTDPLVRCHWDSSVNTVFERCTFGEESQVGFPDAGILGHSFTVDRCDISRVVDGIRNVNSDTGSNCGDITVKGSYVHDLIYQVPSTDGSDNQSHNDCIQLVGGDNITILGNVLRAYVDPDIGSAATAGVPLLDATDVSGNPVTGPQYAWMTALIVTPTTTLGSVTVSRNWLEGGQFTVNVATKNIDYWSAASIAVTNNRFGKDDRLGFGDFIVQNAVASHVTGTGNTFPDGSNVPISNGG